MKYEIRISKYETNTKYEIQMNETPVEGIGVSELSPF